MDQDEQVQNFLMGVFQSNLELEKASYMSQVIQTLSVGCGRRVAMLCGMVSVIVLRDMLPD